MNQEKMIKEELAKALHVHIVLLKGIERIEEGQEDGMRFVVKSLGFMLERIPEALISDDPEDLYYAAFQYYNLLAELKNNLALSYPYLTTVDLSDFPDDYVAVLNTWWEKKTGLNVDEPTKQTMIIN